MFRVPTTPKPQECNALKGSQIDLKNPENPTHSTLVGNLLNLGGVSCQGRSEEFLNTKKKTRCTQRSVFIHLIFWVGKGKPIFRQSHNSLRSSPMRAFQISLKARRAANKFEKNIAAAEVWKLSETQITYCI